MSPLEQEANVFGALSLVVADLTSAAITQACGQSASGAAALSALHQFLDHPTVDELRRVLGLTPSGAVRVVDRLVEAALVTRGPGPDGRSRSLSLTPAGRRAAKRIARRAPGCCRAPWIDSPPVSAAHWRPCSTPWWSPSWPTRTAGRGSAGCVTSTPVSAPPDTARPRTLPQRGLPARASRVADSGDCPVLDKS